MQIQGEENLLIKDISQREKEWAEVEDLVLEYQKQFEENVTPAQLMKSLDAIHELMERFSPLFKKYVILLSTGKINYNDLEMKSFIISFIDDPVLQNALRRKKQKSDFKKEIGKRFKFIVETYGSLSEEDIMLDLQQCFLIIAKRYRQMGKTFCGYLYNAYRFEVSRTIKKYIKNPINIPYKIMEYAECINGELDAHFDFDNCTYEDNIGIPDFNWISGKECSDIFACLTPIERKIIVKYYLEEWNDRQIAESFGMHINTANQKRRQGVYKIAQSLDIDIEDIKRNRRTGKKAILPI